MAAYVNVVLDESGSMESVREATISGFNEYMQGLRKTQKETENAEEILVTLTKFNTVRTENLHERVSLADVPDLTRETYVPDAMTPLYDAVGLSLRALEREVHTDDRVLFVIVTDGLENSSVEWTLDRVFKAITDREAEGNWTFVYLGANQDAYQEGVALGVVGTNTRAYAATPEGTAEMMNTVADASARHIASNVRSTQTFFDDHDGGDDDGHATVSDVAKAVGVSSETVRRAIRAKQLMARRTPGGHYRISLDESRRWLNSL